MRRQKPGIQAHRTSKLTDEMNHTPPAKKPRRPIRRETHGAVLLEVLLALILFAAAAAVATTAFNASITSLERQTLGSQALNLAATVLAEVQLGIRPANSESSRPIEPPFEDWTWETALTPTETLSGGLTGLTRVEVIIRHQKSPTVQRLAQVLRLGTAATTNSTSNLSTGSTSGTPPPL